MVPQARFGIYCSALKDQVPPVHQKLQPFVEQDVSMPSLVKLVPMGSEQAAQLRMTMIATKTH